MQLLMAKCDQCLKIMQRDSELMLAQMREVNRLRQQRDKMLNVLLELCSQREMVN